MDPRVVPGNIADVQGFKANGISAGIKRKRRDMAIIYSSVPRTTAAGVFTTNRVRAAPVLVSERTLARGYARAIVCNAGCANACTGEQGIVDAQRMQSLAAECLHVASEEVVVASTGVIGRHLPMDIVEEGIRNCAGTLDHADAEGASHAIMTTDTGPKRVMVEAEVGDTPIRIAGIAKGAGMIHPNMATMLGFLVTDAAVPPDALPAALKRVVDKTFNMISVDGDTSTNDMVVVLANGLAGNAPATTGSPALAQFERALEVACKDLALKIVADGEGATTVFEVRVTGAATEADARQAARTVTKSPLMKSAIFGRDPNWGRIIAALGYSGARFDPAKVSLTIGNPSGLAKVVENGEPIETLASDELRKLIDAKHVLILCDLNDGAHEATAWGCDLTYEYVKINAEYTT